MNNLAMQQKLRKGEALDVSKCERTITGHYILKGARLTEDPMGHDYCDKQTERWIWSIGILLRPLPSVMADGSRRTLPIGTFLASLDSDLYQNELFHCVWLR